MTINFRNSFSENIYIRLFNAEDRVYFAGAWDVILNPGTEISMNPADVVHSRDRNLFQFEVKVGGLFGPFVKTPWKDDANHHRLTDVYDASNPEVLGYDVLEDGRIATMVKLHGVEHDDGPQPVEGSGYQPGG